MRPRHSLIQLFSTFLEFDCDRSQGWASDPRLRRSMERTLAHAGAAEDSYWALYWHRVWQAEVAPTVGMARGHLTAYIQEPCYWVAQKTASSFSSLHYSSADLFQMAMAQVDKVLRGFDALQGFSLKSYASVTFSNLIRESLRQRQEVDICTDWALLRKLSQKRLLEALQNVGLSGETVAQYLLAWNCFKTLYVPQQATGSRQLAKPESDVWEAIAQLYRQESVQRQSASVEQLEKWLSTCAKAARAYLYPSLISINTPKPGHESGEFLDDLAETAQTESLLGELIAAEEMQQRQAQQQQLNNLLINAIQQFDPESRQLLQLYYQAGLTQQQLADRMEMKQYTVSRRFTRLRESLLAILAQWSQTTLHIQPSTDLLTHTSAALEEWLQTYYAQPASQPASQPARSDVLI